VLLEIRGLILHKKDHALECRECTILDRCCSRHKHHMVPTDNMHGKEIVEAEVGWAFLVSTQTTEVDLDYSESNRGFETFVKLRRKYVYNKGTIRKSENTWESALPFFSRAMCMFPKKTYSLLQLHVQKAQTPIIFNFVVPSIPVI